MSQHLEVQTKHLTFTSDGHGGFITYMTETAEPCAFLILESVLREEMMLLVEDKRELCLVVKQKMVQRRFEGAQRSEMGGLPLEEESRSATPNHAKNASAVSTPVRQNSREPAHPTMMRALKAC